MSLPDVAVIGLGFIGKAQARMFAGPGLVTYDPACCDRYPADDIAACDFAVICVGTPEGPGGAADLSQVEAAFEMLPDGLPVMIRSTVPPGTTDRLQADRPGTMVCHVPEFMHEREGGAWATAEDVPFMIIGGQSPAREFFAIAMAEVFPGKIHTCAALTAEIMKYTVNTYLASKVTFMNEMSAVCDRFGADWEDVREAWLMDPRVTREYSGGIAEFGPGFGGRCWPKDLAALIAASELAGYDPLFLKAIRDANDRFRA